MAPSATPPHGDPAVQPDPQAEDGQPEAAPSTPAGEPEAPVAPAPPEAKPPPEAEPSPEGEPSPEAEPEGPAEDHEAKLEHDLEELTANAEKADEYLELAQRTKADFENYRKRAAREAGAAQERGVVKLALELLPAVDNLDRALEAADGSDDSENLVSGLKLVHAG